MPARRPIRYSLPALFLAATVVFPALHQASHGHGDDHDHGGGGIRFHRHEAPQGHRHGGGRRHTHDAPAVPDESDPRHGEGSLAHFSYALGEDSPPPVAEVSRALESGPAPGRRDEPAAKPGSPRPVADRGPPSSPFPA